MLASSSSSLHLICLISCAFMLHFLCINYCFCICLHIWWEWQDPSPIVIRIHRTAFNVSIFMVHIIQGCLFGFQGLPSSALSLVSMFLFFVNSGCWEWWHVIVQTEKKRPWLWLLYCLAVLFGREMRLLVPPFKSSSIPMLHWGRRWVLR